MKRKIKDPYYEIGVIGGWAVIIGLAIFLIGSIFSPKPSEYVAQAPAHPEVCEIKKGDFYFKGYCGDVREYLYLERLKEEIENKTENVLRSYCYSYIENADEKTWKELTNDYLIKNYGIDLEILESWNSILTEKLSVNEDCWIDENENLVCIIRGVTVK